MLRAFLTGKLTKRKSRRNHRRRGQEEWETESAEEIDRVTSRIRSYARQTPKVLSRIEHVELVITRSGIGHDKVIETLVVLARECRDAEQNLNREMVVSCAEFISRHLYGVEHRHSIVLRKSRLDAMISQGFERAAAEEGVGLVDLASDAPGYSDPVTIQLNYLTGFAFLVGGQQRRVVYPNGALAISRQVHGARDPQTVVALRALSQPCRELGQLEEALPLSTELVQSYPPRGERLPSTLELFDRLNHLTLLGLLN